VTYDYGELEARLNSLLSEGGGWLSREEVQEVREFIDVGEYGLAFETLCGIIVEEDKSISPEVYRQLAELGGLMKMDEQAWSSLKPFTQPG
jgi:hypothetical protein